MTEKKLVVIVGPTAVGKTALALEVARLFNTEIVSADSRQIYKELTIGTAKPDEAELRAVRHHFIDTHTIGEEYDAAQFGRDALEVIGKLFLTHDVVVMTGGSGLYVKAVCEGFDEIPEIAPQIRADLSAQYNAKGIGWLQQQMKDLDPEYFESIDQKNPHRLMRALEVKLGTGHSIRYFQNRKEPLKHPFRIISIGLEEEREVLYQRIDERMDKMIGKGLFEEAEKLFSVRDFNALQTVGYSEIMHHLEGAYDREEAVRLLKRNSRRYAKRQLTWFKRDTKIVWFKPSQRKEIMDLITT